jgi:hypothetical protein
VAPIHICRSSRLEKQQQVAFRATEDNADDDDDELTAVLLLLECDVDVEVEVED